MDDPSCQVGNDPEGSVGVLGKKQEAALLPAVKKSRANAAMVTDIRTANIVSRWNKTGATAPAVANVLETPTAPIFSIPKEHFMLAKDPSNALFTTRNPNGVLADKKRPINVAVSPTKRRKLGRPPSIIATTSATPFALRSNKRILPSLEQPPGRRTTHNWVTAHKFSNAGELMPSVFGLDIIQERLFDKGEIFSFGPLLPYGITCPDGGMRSGTYLTDSVL